MPLLLATPIIIVLVAAGVIGVTTFQLSRSPDTASEVLSDSTSPSETVSTEPSPSVSPSSDTAASSTKPWSVTNPAPSSLHSTSSVAPSSSRLPNRVTPQISHSQNRDEVDIKFTNLPSSVRSGEGFTIAWQVVAPEATSGSNTTLKVIRQSNQQSGSASSNSNSTSSQSFGVFTTPAEFDADFKFSGDAGDIEIEVSATVGGKTITKQTTINFES